MGTAKRKLTPLGVVVKKRLKDLKRTQRSLAAELGMSEFYLMQILRGWAPYNNYEAKIREALKITQEEVEEAGIK